MASVAEAWKALATTIAASPTPRRNRAMLGMSRGEPTPHAGQVSSAVEEADADFGCSSFAKPAPAPSRSAGGGGQTPAPG